MQKHRFLKQLVALVLAAVVLFGIWSFLSTQESAAPENPLLDRNENSSLMFQQEQLTITLDDPSLEQPDAEVTRTPEPSPEVTPEPTENPTPEPTVEPTPETSEIPEATPTPTPPAAVTPAPTPKRTQSTPSKPTLDPNPLITPQPAITPVPTAGTGGESVNTKLIYFTTSIINGSTIPNKELEFSITHKQPHLTPRSITVAVNDSDVQFTGRVLLNEGKNSIKVTVIYSDAEGRMIEVSKTYTVHVEPEKLIITTDLKDRTVNQRSFSFTAYASIGSRQANLSVQINDETVSSTSNHYKATLNPGENTIKLIAYAEGNELTQSYAVNVELPDGIEFITDLYDHEVDNENFSFTAAISGGTERAALTVVANGVTLTSDSNVYSCALARGNNLIRLKATDVDGTEYTQSYTIAYHNYIYQDIDDADETMPRFTTNIADGVSITGNTLTMWVSAADANGGRIYGDHITVQLNGTTLEDHGEDESRTYYNLEFINGVNEVVITVWDYEDRYVYNHYMLNCQTLEAGAEKGSITISVEASTIGLGYLIPPTKMTIYEGENIVIPVAKLLEANGFEYQYSGNLKDGFYLAHLLKNGITNGWSIPADLESAIDEDGLMWTNSYHTDSLGEFDFTQGAGWMYSINGDYPNYSMSECFPVDGDVARIRFTLAYGRDVGGAAANGGTADNYGQEW